MTPGDAARLLAAAAVFDRRTVGETDAAGWAIALNGFEFDECRDAIVAHYRAESRWVMPADIISRVLTARRAAKASEVAPTPPRAVADRPRAEQRWLAAWRAAGGITDPVERYRAACERSGIEFDPEDVADRVPMPGRVRALVEATRKNRPMEEAND